MIRILSIASVAWLEIVRRKDAYVLLVVLGALVVGFMGVDAFGLEGAANYVKDVGFAAAWLFAWILAATMPARPLPQEQTRGTIFALLAKPVTRAHVIVGKWLGAWAAVAAATGFFYALVTGIVLARGGSLDPLTLLQAYLLHAAALALVSALGIALSTRLNHDAATALTFLITAAAFTLVPRVPRLLAFAHGPSSAALYVVYVLFPHFELLDLRQRLVNDWGPAPWPAVGAALLYAALLAGALLAVAWLAYRRRTFSRSEVL